MKIYAIQSTSIKVPLGWVKKVKTIMLEKTKYSTFHIYLLKRVKHNIYYLENSNLT